MDVARDIEKLAEAIDDSAMEPTGMLNQRFVNRTGDIMIGNLTVSAMEAAPTAGTGVRIFNDGGISALRERDAGAHIVLYRGFAQNGAIDEQYMRFSQRSGSSGYVTAGTITLESGPSVRYNSASDYRLKDEQGGIDNPSERLKALRPITFSWKETGNVEEGFIAHEVAEVAPHAVIGEKDAVTGDPDPDDPHAPPAGTIDPQLLSAEKLLPLVVAALQDALARIEQLEGSA